MTGCRSFCCCPGCVIETYSALAWAFYFGWRTWRQTGLPHVSRALGGEA